MVRNSSPHPPKKSGSSSPCDAPRERRKNFLPEPRTVSAQFHPDRNVSSPEATLMLMQFGQFLDHDITLTPEAEEEEAGEDCCGGSHREGEDYCLPIRIDESDRFAAVHNRTCADFKRSTAFCRGELGFREQMNAITAFVDASNVYGSDDETAARLRTLRGGRLRVSTVGGRDYLPVFADGRMKAGDQRALEMPGLAAMHTLFLREHNRLADQGRNS